mmetsp:Transcript_1557/g.3670  ORF Transcript_1557/g.3670 Transcript_1557/m.3670 type:complete len:1484 (+) Transcript_1557:640-5091(+)
MRRTFSTISTACERSLPSIRGASDRGRNTRTTTSPSSDTNTAIDSLIVMLLASGQCGVLSGNHTRLAMQKYMAENGGEKMMALRIHFVALSEILFHDDMKEVTKRLVAVCNGGRKAMRETWAEKMDSIPMLESQYKELEGTQAGAEISREQFFRMHCDSIGAFSEVDTILHSCREGWNRSGVFKRIAKQLWRGSEDDIKIGAVHKGKLQPLRLRKLSDSARDGFLSAWLLTTHRTPRVQLSLDECVTLLHLCKKNIPATVAPLTPRWCEHVELISGVVKYAKLEQMDKKDDISSQPASLDIQMLDGRPWRVLVPTEIHPDLIGLSNEFFGILPRREYLNSQKIQKNMNTMSQVVTPFICNSAFSGVGTAVAGSTKMSSRMMINSTDRDSAIKSKEGMSCLVATTDEDGAAPPIAGVIKKLQYRPRGPDTAACEQTAMRRRHQAELTDLESGWTTEHRLYQKEILLQKRAVLEQEARPTNLENKHAARRGNQTSTGSGSSSTSDPAALLGLAADSQMHVTEDSQSQAASGIVPLAAGQDIAIDAEAGREDGVKAFQGGRNWPAHLQARIDDYSVKFVAYNTRRAQLVATHKSEATDMADRVAQATSDKLSSVKIKDDRVIVAKQDRISCDVKQYRFTDRTEDIFTTTVCTLKNAQAVPLEIPAVFETSMVQPALTRALEGVEPVLLFSASGGQGSEDRIIDLSPLTIELHIAIPHQHLTKEARASLACASEAVGKLLIHTKIPIFREKLRDGTEVAEDGEGGLNDAQVAALQAEAADENEALEIRNGPLVAPSNLVDRVAHFGCSLWTEETVGKAMIAPLDDATQFFRIENLLVEKGSRADQWFDEDGNGLTMPEPAMLFTKPDGSQVCLKVSHADPRYEQWTNHPVIAARNRRQAEQEKEAMAALAAAGAGPAGGAEQNAEQGPGGDVEMGDAEGQGGAGLGDGDVEMGMVEPDTQVLPAPNAHTIDGVTNAAVPPSNVPAAANVVSGAPTNGASTAPNAVSSDGASTAPNAVSSTSVPPVSGVAGHSAAPTTGATPDQSTGDSTASAAAATGAATGAATAPSTGTATGAPSATASSSGPEAQPSAAGAAPPAAATGLQPSLKVSGSVPGSSSLPASISAVDYQLLNKLDAAAGVGVAPPPPAVASGSAPSVAGITSGLAQPGAAPASSPSVQRAGEVERLLKSPAKPAPAKHASHYMFKKNAPPGTSMPPTADVSIASATSATGTGSRAGTPRHGDFLSFLAAKKLPLHAGDSDLAFNLSDDFARGLEEERVNQARVSSGLPALGLHQKLGRMSVVPRPSACKPAAASYSSAAATAASRSCSSASSSATASPTTAPATLRDALGREYIINDAGKRVFVAAVKAEPRDDLLGAEDYEDDDDNSCLVVDNGSFADAALGSGDYNGTNQVDAEGAFNPDAVEGNVTVVEELRRAGFTFEEDDTTSRRRAPGKKTPTNKRKGSAGPKAPMKRAKRNAKSTATGTQE